MAKLITKEQMAEQKTDNKKIETADIFPETDEFSVFRS